MKGGPYKYKIILRLCTPNCQPPSTLTPAKMIEKIVENNITPLLEASALPNPSANQFTLKIEGANLKEPIVVRIVDVFGKELEVITNIYEGKHVTLGSY